jgi:hypothetical protein
VLVGASTQLSQEQRFMATLNGIAVKRAECQVRVARINRVNQFFVTIGILSMVDPRFPTVEVLGGECRVVARARATFN